MLAVLNTQIPDVIIFIKFFNIKRLRISDTPAVAKFCFSSNSQQSLIGQGLLFINRSRSHSDTPHSVGLPWRCNHPDAWACTWQHTILTRDGHPCPKRESNPQSQPSERPQSPHLKSRGHWDRQQVILLEEILTEPCDAFSNIAACFSLCRGFKCWSGDRLLWKSSVLVLTSSIKMLGWDIRSRHDHLVTLIQIYYSWIISIDATKLFRSAKKIRGFVKHSWIHVLW